MSSPAVIFPKAPISKASAAPASATSPSVRELEAVPMPVRRPGPTWTNLEVAAHREGAARLRARLQAVAVAPGPQNQVEPVANRLRGNPAPRGVHFIGELHSSSSRGGSQNCR
jgi:hypothetical protein